MWGSKNIHDIKIDHAVWLPPARRLLHEAALPVTYAPLTDAKDRRDIRM
jgi:hypothetical protein